VAELAGVMVLGVSTADASEVCDRNCLDPLVDGYIAAVVAHAPVRLRLARHVAFTENGVHPPPGRDCQHAGALQTLRSRWKGRFLRYGLGEGSDMVGFVRQPVYRPDT
jgi:hypothetical protein